MVLILAIAKSRGIYFPAVLSPEESVDLMGNNRNKTWGMVKKHFSDPLRGTDKNGAIQHIQELKRERADAREIVHPDILWVKINRDTRTVEHFYEDMS
jgi:hypothetical protein